MQRGRKPNPTVEQHPVTIDEERLRADMDAASQLPALIEQEQQHKTAIMDAYGDGLPYDRMRYIDKCRYHMSRSAEEALEVGRCLIVMKEHEGHGNWLPVLEDLGVDQRLAQRMMQTAVRFSNTALTTHLLEAAKTKTKLFELLVLDDEEMSALNDGGTVRGLDLDDVERMSVSELRRALRQARADKDSAVTKAVAENSAALAAKDRLLADKSQRIAELVAEKNANESMTDSERALFAQQRIADATQEAIEHLIPLNAALSSMRALDKAGLGLETAAQQALERISAELYELGTTYGVAFSLAPEWTDDQNASLSAAEAGTDWIETSVQ